MKNTTFSLLFFLAFTVNAFGQIVWDQAQDVAPLGFKNERPRIALDGNDNPLVIWGNSGNLMFARWSDTNFTAPIQLNPNGVSIAEAFWMGPEIATHGDTVYVVYKQTPESAITSHIWCLRSFDGGQNFLSPIQVENIGNDQSRFPTVSTDDFGNPVIAFMRSNSSMLDPQWHVVKSTDFGATFSADVLASGFSSSSSEACDCCPGSIAISGNTTAMLYRDNNSNIRDSWVGISLNGGTSFSKGMNIDQQNWFITGCPSTSPDGFILNDTLYSTFMSGGSGAGKVYFNKTYVLDTASPAANPITIPNPTITNQNYPRMANNDLASAAVWRQVQGGQLQIAMVSTGNIQQGFSSMVDTVAAGTGLNNPDVKMTNYGVAVVWEDDISKTVRFRRGTFASFIGIPENVESSHLLVYPNPANTSWFLALEVEQVLELKLYDLQGKLLNSIKDLSADQKQVEIPNSDLPNGSYVLSIVYASGKTKTLQLQKAK